MLSWVFDMRRTRPALSTDGQKLYSLSFPTYDSQKCVVASSECRPEKLFILKGPLVDQELRNTLNGQAGILIAVARNQVLVRHDKGAGMLRMLDEFLSWNSLDLYVLVLTLKPEQIIPANCRYLANRLGLYLREHYVNVTSRECRLNPRLIEASQIRPVENIILEFFRLLRAVEQNTEHPVQNLFSGGELNG